MSADLALIMPEVVLAAGGVILFVLPKLRSAAVLGGITLVLLGIAAWLKLGRLIPSEMGTLAFSNMLLQDRFGGFIQMAILAATALVVLSLMGYAREEVRGRREIYGLLLLSTVGLLVMAAAQHLALLYLSLELVSVLSYLLVGFQKKESLSIEAALKYFLFGALSTGAFLYGLSLLYGLTGSMDLPTVAAALTQGAGQAPGVTLAALLLLAAGLGFKLALVPFHMWAPDAYEGAPAPVASFISLGPKLAALAALVRLVLQTLAPEMHSSMALLAALSVVTMTAGNVIALAQTNVKRLLAYSSIAHAGTMVIGLAVATPLGMAALLYYLVAYLLMNAGAFIGVIAVGNAAGREDVGAFSGLSRREPAMAALITVCFLALAGVPPLAGFFGKMWIFAAALDAGFLWLAVVAAINSVIALFYYVRVIKAMYLDPAPAGASTLPRVPSLRLALSLCAAGLFLVGLWQGPWLDLARSSSPALTSIAALPWR